MFKHNYNVIGVMSGTSLDGVDLAHIYFEIKNDNWTYQIVECDTISYNNEMISKLKNGIHFTKTELSELNTEYTNLLGNIISEFIIKNKISNLDAICSHGHTILHQPENGFTLQIGNLPEIAKITNQKVVCNFRVQDVLFGGQGAPLVPIGDKILFSDDTDSNAKFANLSQVAKYINAGAGSVTSVDVSGGTTGAMNSNASHTHPNSHVMGTSGGQYGFSDTGNAGSSGRGTTLSTNTDHTHTFTPSISNASAGSDSRHATIPPCVVVNYLIKI